MRTVLAIVLLATAILAGVIAIAVATVAALAIAVVYAVTAGSVAARLLADETAKVRRAWARDRATTAHVHGREVAQRAKEQVAFADSMAARVRDRDARLGELTERLSVAEQALEDARTRHRAARQRADVLRTDLDETRAALAAARREVRTLQDDLATSRGAEQELRDRLAAWQETADVESRRLA